MTPACATQKTIRGLGWHYYEQVIVLEMEETHKHRKTGIMWTLSTPVASVYFLWTAAQRVGFAQQAVSVGSSLKV